MLLHSWLQCVVCLFLKSKGLTYSLGWTWGCQVLRVDAKLYTIFCAPSPCFLAWTYLLWTWELFSQITCYVVWYSPLLSIYVYCKCWNWNKILNQKLQIFTCLVNLGSNRIKISMHFTVLLSWFYAQLYLGTVKLCVTYCLKELLFGVCAYLIAFTNFRQCTSSCLESFFRKVWCSYELLQFQKVTFKSLNCCLHMLKSSFFRKTEIKGIVLFPAELQDFCLSLQANICNMYSKYRC